MTEHEHCKDVANELVCRLAARAKAYGCWNTPDPYETQHVQLLIMAEKLQKLIARIPPIPDSTP